MRKTVAEGYAAQFSDPIKLREGDKLHVQCEDVEYPGWFWCEHRTTAKCGWTPGSCLSAVAGEARALCDYDATELSVEVGDVVDVSSEFGGWAVCESSDGRRGWLPEKNLRRT